MTNQGIIEAGLAEYLLQKPHCRWKIQRFEQPLAELWTSDPEECRQIVHEQTSKRMYYDGALIPITAFAHSIIAKHELFTLLTACFAGPVGTQECHDDEREDYLRICFLFALRKKKLSPIDILQYIFSTQNSYMPFDEEDINEDEREARSRLASTITDAMIYALAESTNPDEIFSNWQQTEYGKTPHPNRLRRRHECEFDLLYAILQLHYPTVTTDTAIQLLHNLCTPETFRIQFCNIDDDIETLGDSQLSKSGENESYKNQSYWIYHILKAANTQGINTLITQIADVNESLANHIGNLWNNILLHANVKEHFDEQFAVYPPKVISP